ncbi:hypothetical protein Dimus_015530, partial [Dionaea muscipula]
MQHTAKLTDAKSRHGQETFTDLQEYHYLDPTPFIVQILSIEPSTKRTTEESLMTYNYSAEGEFQVPKTAASQERKVPEK